LVTDDDQLFTAIGLDFGPIYRQIAAAPEIAEGALLPEDRAYAALPRAKKEGPRVSTAQV